MGNAAVALDRVTNVGPLVTALPFSSTCTQLYVSELSSGSDVPCDDNVTVSPATGDAGTEAATAVGARLAGTATVTSDEPVCGVAAASETVSRKYSVVANGRAGTVKVALWVFAPVSVW